MNATIIQARELYKARMKEIIDLDFRGIGNEEEINSRYNYKHGWIIVSGQSFDAETLFPEQHHPRFPADQGVSD